MTQVCKKCARDFDVTDADVEFYEKVSPIFSGKKYGIPQPSLCPSCRFQRRLSFRNERVLYRRRCDLTGRDIISMYSPEKPFPVYVRDAWWSEQWDPLTYGRDFDFARPFFEQFNDLLLQVPRVSLNTQESVNSDFCNFDLRNKNCYLIFTSAYCEDCYYSNRLFKDRNCLDCSNVECSELCYECIDSDNCYSCGWLQNSFNSNGCFLGYNLRGCNDCFGCFNLTNQSYCIYNKSYSKEEYRGLLPQLLANIEEEKKRFVEYMGFIPKKYMNGLTFENSTGDSIYNSKNALDCYEVKNLQDCKFVSDASNLRDVYDADNDDNAELNYEVMGSEENYMHCFSDICWFDKFSYYNSLCFNSQHIWGCVGLKKHSYCILNKHYTKEGYEALLPRIIEHMQRTGEWGEFFPSSISPYGYNETRAQEFFPLTKEIATAQGFQWFDDSQETLRPQTEDSITCEVTGRHFKLIPQELEFYKQMGIPVPRKHPDQRYKERMALRNPRELWGRPCTQCGKNLQSTYAPHRVEQVLCEACYATMSS